MNTGRIVERIRQILEPIAGPAGIEIVDVTLHNESGRWILRVTIDQEGGVTVDSCTFINRELGVHMDVEDLIPVRYYLEVSSPGLDRPLKDERDFERFAGRLVLIRTHRSVGGRKKIRGTLEGLRDGVITVRLEEGVSVQVPLEDVSSARLDFDF